MRRTFVLSVAVLGCLCCPLSATEPAVFHRIEVRLDTAGHTIDVVDEITIGDTIDADADGAYRFILHDGLAPAVDTPGWRLERMDDAVQAEFLGINATSETVAGRVPLEGWRLVPGEAAAAAGPVALRYGGPIYHPLATQGEEYQRSFTETPGLVGESGVFLAGTSFWVPTFGDGLVAFELTVEGLAPPWDAVSQGQRTRHDTAHDGTRTTTWSCPHPSEEVYLVAGPWHEFADRAGRVQVLALLRENDPGLAQRYLQATRRYLTMYEDMLTAFPYASFSLVENFWETGYGMPGFTLLGPRVIRFPWILTSSYPHELLHNWWGNGVYVDFATGNWCEGLTAYMADHLFAEQRGEGATYRRATLKKYTDFVGDGTDLSLSEFRSRHSAASEAVGYGKSLMLFHMVRRAVGEEAFLAALRRFDAEHRHTRASFADIATALEAETGGDWGPWFDTWTTRTGAPTLKVADVTTRQRSDGSLPWEVRVALRQVQDEDPFPVTVPVAVTVEGRDEPVWAEAGSCGRACTITVPCPGRPLRIDVDPAFDVMRRLHPLEVPPALSTLFGADDPVFVLPADAPADELDAWRELASAWARPGTPRTVLDSELSALPDGPAWLLGWSNRLGGAVSSRLVGHGVEVRDEAVAMAADTVDRAGHSLVLVARGAPDPSTAVAWVTADPPAAVAGLARKLPHYTKYSYLAFRGDEPENVVKGMWQPVASPLVHAVTDGNLPPLNLPQARPLAELPPAYDGSALRQTVEHLSSAPMEGRGLGSAGLERATRWVEARFEEIGLEPAGDDGFRQSWTWRGGEGEHEMELSNLVARIPGTEAELSNQPVLVMAHLDHLGRGWPDVRDGNEGSVHPGADDNASGVAVLLELARAMAAEGPRPRPVIVAAVTGEEAGLVGSRHLLEAMAPDQLPFACVNLDTVGRLADGRLYVLRADTAREWRHIFMGVGFTTGADVAIVSEPLDSSDQKACIEHGVPAVQLFTGPHGDYHRPSDTADKVDASGLATVTEATHQVVGYLAERSEPLVVTIANADEPATPAQQPSSRRASLGTMPDFAFADPGVRIQQVMPGSAAEAAGLLAGDVIVAIGANDVSDLRGFSNILKEHAPGDEVTVNVLRDGEELAFTAVLGSR